MTLLAIDVGNTNITVGKFRGKILAKKVKMPTHSFSLGGLELKDITACVISSVVPKVLPSVIKKLRKIKKCKIKVVGKDIVVPIKNRYRIKSQVGQDRLVNAFAAKKLYGSPAIVIDFGTAITFDIVSKKGEYLGGLILPGIEISLSSLYEKTALLPKVKLAPSFNIIGKDTVNSMRGGILFGFGAMADGLVAKYKKILGRETKVIATGGNAGLIKRYTKYIQIVDENLTLEGLSLIRYSIHPPSPTD